LIVSKLKVFGWEVSGTGKIFAGLGCPNGCDFCCTSHFFKRRHVRLLPTGRDIYRVIERYQEIEPGMGIVVLDEDFLLNRKRAMEFRDCVREGGRPLSIFVFSSIKAISQYTVQEILEMGIDGFWIGYEGTRSGYAKQSGRPVDELFRELKANGISILASMIVGLPYQTPGIIDEELDGLLALQPDLAQFLIYGPSPGTPFFEQVMREGRLHPDMVADPELYYRRCTGFSAMVTHPAMSAAEIESAQRRCFDQDFARLGPTVYRSLGTWLIGHLALKDSPDPILRAKAQRIAVEIRQAYPAFLAGRLLGPTAVVRRSIADLERRIHAVIGRPTLVERAQSVAALGLAAWTGLTLKLGLFQHPSLMRHTFRMPEDGRPRRAWRRLRPASAESHQVEVELRPESTVWVRLKGRLALAGAETLATGLREALRRTEDRLILDLRRLMPSEPAAAERLASALAAYRDRIRVVMPPTGEMAALSAVFAMYR